MKIKTPVDIFQEKVRCLRDAMKNRLHRFKSHFFYKRKWVIFNVVFLTISASSYAQNHTPAETTDHGSRHTQTLRKLSSLAENGDRDVQFNLGRIYLRGKETPQDYQAARKWFMRAAEQEDAGAQYNLGSIYKNGQGIQQDCKKAFFWYKKAAAKLYAPAQYALGKLYSSGCGVPQNPYIATEWFRKAAYNGIPEAQFQMGYRYFTGSGIRSDKNKAYEWLEKAARQNNRSAIRVLKANFALENMRNSPVLK